MIMMKREYVVAGSGSILKKKTSTGMVSIEPPPPIRLSEKPMNTARQYPANCPYENDIDIL
jgi:hypothetical protein